MNNRGYKNNPSVPFSPRFKFAVSQGGVESLIQHPASLTHDAVPKEKRDRVGVTDNLVRLSVGIEGAGDLIAGLEQAFTLGL